jgi:hypothetical protein
MVRFHIECPRCDAEHPLMWAARTSVTASSGSGATLPAFAMSAPTAVKASPRPTTWPVACPWTGPGCASARASATAVTVSGATRIRPCLPPKTLGLHVWTGYSPQRAWSDIVQEFENALKKLEAGDVEPMKLFVNETLGETWELKGDRTDEHALQARAEPYPWGWCARVLCTSLQAWTCSAPGGRSPSGPGGAAWRVGPSRGSASTAIRQWMRTGSRSRPSCCSGFSKPATGPAWASAQPALTPRPDACRLQLGAQQPGPHPEPARHQG